MAYPAVAADRTAGSPAQRVLLCNAAFSAAGGLVLIAGMAPLARFFGVPEFAVLPILGTILVLYAASLAWTATRDHVEAGTVRTAAYLDAAWVVASVLLVVDGPLPLTTVGRWCVLDVALVVAVFAVVQYRIARRMR